LRTHRGKAGFRIVALTGYTQSGKTTLFNRLASESKEVGLGPFTTLSSFARKIPVESGSSFIMVDSIGFIEELNPLLLNAFRTTLSELANSDLVLLFVDGSDDIETVIRKTSASHEAMQKEVPGVPILVCVNKIDIATREHLDKVLKEVRRVFETEEIIEISAKTGANDSVLLSKIAKRLATTHPILKHGLTQGTVSRKN
ncbi:MAG: GTP-binding protein, partial [Candidatus Bathyarchaeia archaeon]